MSRRTPPADTDPSAAVASGTGRKNGRRSHLAYRLAGLPELTGVKFAGPNARRRSVRPGRVNLPREHAVAAGQAPFARSRADAVRSCSALQKASDLLQQTAPSRIASQNEMVAAFQRDEARARNAGRDPAPFLKRLHGVVATMKHQRGRLDPGQEVGHVDFVDGAA